MNKYTLFPLMIGLSVCFHAGLLLFLSVNTSGAPGVPAQKDQGETFSLVNIALIEPAAPPPASPKPPPPRPSEPLPVPETEPAEQYLDQAAERVADRGETEDRALVPVEGAGHTGTMEKAPETRGRTAENAAHRAEYIKHNYRYLQRRIRDKLVYPASARKAGIQGISEVSFTIHEDGRVSAVTLVKSSGHPILDEAAMETIYAAAPFPRPPGPARIAIPIAFRLR